MPNARRLSRSFSLLALCATASFAAHASSYTHTGTFSTDDQVFSYNFSNTSSQVDTFYTTSYAGGLNADGTRTPGGGFAPVLSIFNSGTGQFVAGGGSSGICGAGAGADASTGLCNDAFFSATLMPGSYVLDLTEFPNTPINNLSDGFLFAGSPTITGDVCSVAGGKFLESDVAPCVQRTGNYAVNITSSAAVTPEPASWLLMLAPLLAIPLVRRRYLA